MEAKRDRRTLAMRQVSEFCSLVGVGQGLCCVTNSDFVAILGEKGINVSANQLGSGLARIGIRGVIGPKGTTYLLNRSVDQLKEFSI